LCFPSGAIQRDPNYEALFNSIDLPCNLLHTLDPRDKGKRIIREERFYDQVEAILWAR
jgi:hypothetical protein